MEHIVYKRRFTKYPNNKLNEIKNALKKCLILNDLILRNKYTISIIKVKNNKEKKKILNNKK